MPLVGLLPVSGRPGLDGVLIHGAHGYLTSVFLSPLTNKRTDEWGGDASKRFRFLDEVYHSIRKSVGNDYPVAIKLGIKDDTEEGLSLEEGAEVASRLATAGIDAIEISGGIPTKAAAASRSNILSREQEAYFLPYAKALRPKVGRLPLSLVGGLRSPGLMEEIIKAGWTDFVSLRGPSSANRILSKRSAKTAGPLSRAQAVTAVGLVWTGKASAAAATKNLPGEPSRTEGTTQFRN